MAKTFDFYRYINLMDDVDSLTTENPLLSWACDEIRRAWGTYSSLKMC